MTRKKLLPPVCWPFVTRWVSIAGWFTVNPFSYFLSLASFYYLHEKRAVPAFICLFLLPLSRPTGILILAPLIVESVMSRGKNIITKYRSRLPMAVAVIFGFAFYLLIMKIWTGSFWTGYEAQALYHKAGHLKVFGMNPFQWFWDNFVVVSYTFNGLGTSVLDRIAFLLFFLTLPLAWKKISPTFFAYLCVLSLVSALSVDLTSFARYSSVVFPFFLLQALLLKNRVQYFLWACLPLQAVLVVLHSLNYWVG